MLTGRPSRSSNAAISRGWRGAPAALPRLADTAPRTSTRGGSALCQEVTVASRYRVSRSRGVLPATQSSADSRNASWLSSPASAWWRIEGYLSPRFGTSSSQRYPDHGRSIGDAPAVGGDPDHVGPPGARLREHLERELLVVGPIAPRHEPELQDDDGDDHHPPPDDSDPRPHAATMTPPGDRLQRWRGVLRGRHLAARRRPGALHRAAGCGSARRCCRGSVAAAGRWWRRCRSSRRWWRSPWQRRARTS